MPNHTDELYGGEAVGRRGTGGRGRFTPNAAARIPC